MYGRDETIVARLVAVTVSTVTCGSATSVTVCVASITDSVSLTVTVATAVSTTSPASPAIVTVVVDSSSVVAVVVTVTTWHDSKTAPLVPTGTETLATLGPNKIADIVSVSVIVVGG